MMKDLEKKLLLSTFDEDIASLALQLQELKRSPSWKEIRKIVLHIRPSDGRINKNEIIRSRIQPVLPIKKKIQGK